jgi:hypothetical protein
MKLNLFVYRNAVLSWLVLGVLVNSANAGTPARCTDKCTPNCGSTGDNGLPCLVKVSETKDSNGQWVTTVNTNPICVFSDTDIIWYTSERNSTFTVTFATPHPFASTPAGTFNGKKGQPSGDTASIPQPAPASNCYEYSVKHCIPGRPCAKVDPKVIVNGVRLPPGTGSSKDPVKK